MQRAEQPPEGQVDQSGGGHALGVPMQSTRGHAAQLLATNPQDATQPIDTPGASDRLVVEVINATVRMHACMDTQPCIWMHMHIGAYLHAGTP